MIERKQLFRHRPAEGTIGDCHRTAIACLLDLEPTEVPHFGEMYFETPELFHGAFEKWLKDRGLGTVSVAWDCTLEQVLAAQGSVNSDAYYLLGGRSSTGFDHTVVAHGGAICWDPGQQNQGIVGPSSDGYIWVTYIVPAFMKERKSPC